MIAPQDHITCGTRSSANLTGGPRRWCTTRRNCSARRGRDAGEPAARARAFAGGAGGRERGGERARLAGVTDWEDCMDRVWHLTWTTYGTWLPGDERGFVSNVRDGDGPEVKHNTPATPY